MTKSLRERLSNAASSTSKTDRALAAYMLAEIANLPFETAASVAARVEVSEPTVGRFCRAMGYDGFKDLKNTLRNDMGDQPWLIGDRLRDLQERTKAGEGQLAKGLELELAALVAVYEAAHTDEWDRLVKRLARSQSVFVGGFHNERGIAQFFTHQLQQFRDNVHLLDLANGSIANLLTSDGADSAMLIFEARRYPHHALLLAIEAKAAGIPVALVTDPYCDWGHRFADEIFVVPTSFNLNWESTAQMTSLANLLVNGVFMELGPQAETRMKAVSQLFHRFTGHVADTFQNKIDPRT